MKKILLIFIPILLFSITYIHKKKSGFELGSEANDKGDYVTALREWLPLAKAGNSDGQFLVAFMYEYGKGTSKNLKEAFKWELKAAKQGHRVSQFVLGKMHEKGSVVKKDRVKALMWYNLASIERTPSWLDDFQERHTKDRDRFKKKLSRSEIQEANRLTREWLKKHINLQKNLWPRQLILKTFKSTERS